MKKKSESLPTPAQVRMFASFVKWMAQERTPQTNFESWRKSLTPTSVAEAVDGLEEGKCEVCPAYEYCKRCSAAKRKKGCKHVILAWASVLNDPA